MFALHSRRLRRRLSATTSGSARRRARERKLAEQTRAEGERLARERRDQTIKDKAEQHRKARQELASHEPWGRAGGGAPNQRGVRFCNLRAAGIYPEDELRGVLAYGPGRRWSSPRRRRRTPLRLREDPQLYFADQLRQSVDNDIRYKQTADEQEAYKLILDDMVNKKKKKIQEEIKRDLEYERKMQTMDGPWGKPGPGGTKWRNPRDIGLNFSKSMGWTDNDFFKKIKGDHKHCKLSSLTLPKLKRADDDLNKDIDKENRKPSSVEKLPRIKKQDTSNETEKEQNDQRSKNVNNIYGSNKNRSPKKGKFIKRLSNGDRVNKTIPEDEATNHSVFETKSTPEATILRLTGGVELVPLLARRRRVGARTLPSSDVTRPPEQSCQWRELFDVDYLGHLKHQMRVKYEKKEASRRDSAESVRQHHATWASLWGRPGHGAPQQRGRYARSNLAQLLYVPPLNAKL